MLGLVNYTGTQWVNNFYPDDLPADWTLDYYSNEFHSLLIDDLNDKNKLQIELFKECVEDSLDDDFDLFIPKSYQTDFGLIDDEQMNLVYVDEFVEIKTYNGLSYCLIDSLDSVYGSNEQGTKMLFKFHCDEVLEPMTLKQLIETCIEMLDESEPCDIYLFFSDSTHAIMNTRNAILLSEML